MNFLLPIILFFSFIGTAQAFTLHVSDDTYMDNTETNYGDSPNLWVSPSIVTLLRFKGSSLNSRFNAEHIVSATLRLHIKSITKEGSIKVNRAGSDLLQEDETMWNTRVGYYGQNEQTIAIAEDSENDTGSFIFIDVTEIVKLVHGQEYRNFMIRSDDGVKASFSSKESGGNAPQLEVLLKDPENGALKVKQGSMQGTMILLDGDLQDLEGKVTVNESSISLNHESISSLEGELIDLIEEGLSPLKGLEKRIKELEKLLLEKE